MMRKIATLMLGFAAAMTAHAQEKGDTVIVSLGRTSKVVFTMGDRSDLDILKYYNFQELFKDILLRIERSDSTRSDSTAGDSGVAVGDERDAEPTTPREDDNAWRDESDEEEDWSDSEKYSRGRIGRTWQTSNMDFGINNYLTPSDQLPDESENHAVRAWGSWYIGINSLQRTKLGRNFFLEWGLGVSWYNFKFQNDQVSLVKTPEMVEFNTSAANPEYDYIKSKLRVTYLNASLIPVLDFGDRGRKPRLWDSYGNAFRIGIGPYVGYKIGSKSKIVYNDEGDDRKKEKDRDGFHLNDLRYGARLQIGFRSTDFFFNYDVNELFREGKGPALNAMSFGIVF